MIKSKRFEIVQNVYLFINRTSKGDVAVNGGPKGSPWRFSMVFQGLSPEAFVEAIRAGKDFEGVTRVLSSFSLADEKKEYKDVPLAVEFDDNGVCTVKGGGVTMTFTGGMLSHQSLTGTNTYTEEVEGVEKCVTWCIQVQGGWPTEALKLAEPAARPRTPYKGTASRAPVRQTTPPSGNAKDDEIPF